MKIETSDGLDLVRYGFERGAEACNKNGELFAMLSVFYCAAALLLGAWFVLRERLPPRAALAP